MCDYSLAIFPSTISGLIMKKLNTLLIVLLCFNSYAQIIEKTYYFDNHKVIQKSGYQIIDFKNTLLTGNTNSSTTSLARPYCSPYLDITNYSGITYSTTLVSGDTLTGITTSVINSIPLVGDLDAMLRSVTHAPMTVSLSSCKFLAMRRNFMSFIASE